MIRAIVTDIEGTTSSIHFVHQVLFPFSVKALPGFVRANAEEPEVRRWLAQVASESGLAGDDLDGIIAVLLAWIKEDRKHTALKALQGLIWAEGYAREQFRAHVYPDVAASLSAWHEAGLRLFVYSSGSIAAQLLFFGHSEAGDLRPAFEGYFDTTSGPKREAESYRRIAAAIGLPAKELLFLSDIEAELDAARAAGWATILLAREVRELPTSSHRVVRSFAEINPLAHTA